MLESISNKSRTLSCILRKSYLLYCIAKNKFKDLYKGFSSTLSAVSVRKESKRVKDLQSKIHISFSANL